MSVNELSGLLNISAATVRKDLSFLEEQHLVRREQGYARLESGNPIAQRMAVRYAAKTEIATEAARLVREGDTVFIESGTTCILLAETLKRQQKAVNIVTNSVFLAAYLNDPGRLHITLTGGDYQSDSMALVGPLALQSLNAFHVKYFFTGADGYSADAGFSGDNLLRVELLHAMAAKADRTVLLFDHDKFSRKGTVLLFSEKDVDVLISEKPIEAPSIRNRLEDSGVRVLIADEG